MNNLVLQTGRTAHDFAEASPGCAIKSTPPAQGRWGNPDTGQRRTESWNKQCTQRWNKQRPVPCVRQRAAMRRWHQHRRGLSLLEVILAIAILGGALAAIGHLVRLGSRSAVKADRLNTAQIICQTKMAEITSGATSLSTGGTGWTSYEFDAEWQYMIEMVSVDSMPGLVAVHVSAQENLPAKKQPVTFTLIRWMPDPTLNLEQQNEAYKEAAALAEEEASD